MIDEHSDIALGLDFLQNALEDGYWLFDIELFERIRMLPDGHIMRASADNAHAQAVFQFMDGIRRDGQLALLVADVAAQADCIQVGQVVV